MRLQCVFGSSGFLCSIQACVDLQHPNMDACMWQDAFIAVHDHLGAATIMHSRQADSLGILCISCQDPH